MKLKGSFFVIIIMLAVVTNAQVPRVLSYQGVLTASPGAAPINGMRNLGFALYESEDDFATPIWTETHLGVHVQHGVFAVYLGSATPFPSSVDFSKQYWLGISIDGGAELSPRFLLTASPYALNIPNMGAEDGQVLKWNATDEKWEPATINIEEECSTCIARSDSDSACVEWKYDGNGVIWTALHDQNSNPPCSLTYLGIAKGNAGNALYGVNRRTHVNLGASSTTGLSGYNFEFCTISGGSDNQATNNLATIAGGLSNSATQEGCFIGGGVRNEASEVYSLITGGFANKARGQYSLVCGGYGNSAYGHYSVIAGGTHNTATSEWSSVGGGTNNTADSTYTTVSGGSDNYAHQQGATVGGGVDNTADGFYATACGGLLNSATTSWAIVCGGYFNNANGLLSTICGGEENTVNSDYGFIGGGQNDTIREDVPHSVIGGGQYNIISSTKEGTTSHAVIGGGFSNKVFGSWSGVFSGYNNWAGDSAGLEGCSFVGGGANNIARDTCSTIAGGCNNEVLGRGAAITGGGGNNINGDYSFIGGGRKNSISNELTGDYSVIGGGDSNTVFADSSVIAGGARNRICHNAIGSFIGGGLGNVDSAAYSLIGGGRGNFIGEYVPSQNGWHVICGGDSNYIDSTRYAAIGGGRKNRIIGNAGTIGGGDSNTVITCSATIGGGLGNLVSSKASAIGGGKGNYIDSGGENVIPGGQVNYIESDGDSGPYGEGAYEGSYYSFASGVGNVVRGDVCFAYGDSCLIDTASYSLAFGHKDTIMNCEHSMAFGNGVRVDNDYIAAFYNEDNPGKVGINQPDPEAELHVNGTVKIKDILKLETRETAPSGLGTEDRGTIYYHYNIGPPLVNMLYVWDGSDWQPLW